MSARPINLYAITARREAQTDTVSPDDLTLSLLDTSATILLPDRTLPYCVDLPRERVLFTCHDTTGLAQISGAAFMFGEQLATALTAISIPFERLEELPPAPVPPPVFVVSPGRTGSTLLMRLLAASGAACASEPDILTQLVRLSREDLRLLPADTRHILARGCIASLGTALGGGLFIKLRSQCNARPLVLTDTAPGCRVVFMLRGMAGWALSRHRSFAEPPDTVAAILRQAIDALDKLAFSGVPFSVLWFETLVAHPAAALRICSTDNWLAQDRIDTVMTADSQSGTTISRDLVRGLPTQDGFMAAFLASWAYARIGAEWRPETEALLAEMEGG